MPSRKTGSGDGPNDSRRSSLRRLSSIASFQTLFSRRRSTNANDATTTPSSSNISLASSTIANAPESFVPSDLALNSSPRNNDTIAEHPALPMPIQSASRRSSYICLPDDPIGGMPRSRTFSNLPLPTKTRQTTSLISSKSHARLPSTLLPSTRLPTPPASTRRHSHTRLASGSTNIPSIRNRAKRSDTEPLLPVNLDYASNKQRSTAFKENISLSPVKRLPPMDLSTYDSHFDTSFPPTTTQSSEMDWQQHIGTTKQPLSFSNYSSSPYAQHPAFRNAKEIKSTPIFRSSRDRPPTPGGSKSIDLQRWNSQPILKDTTNTSRTTSTQHREPKQTRLLSARQAPTPPPPRTPMSKPTSTVATTRLKSINNSSHIREKSEPTPTHSRSSPTKNPIPPPTKPGQISTPEPPTYWLGRLSALTDRFRNDELAAHLTTSKSKPTAKSETDKMHTQEASTARLRKAFEHLYALCVTREARDSLAVFQMQYAAVTERAELARPIPWGDGSVGDPEGGGDDEVGIGEGRKVTFMDRLLGRQKRSSLILI